MGDQETSLLATALKQRWADMAVDLFSLMNSITGFLSCLQPLVWFPDKSVWFQICVTWAAAELNPDPEVRALVVVPSSSLFSTVNHSTVTPPLSWSLSFHQAWFLFFGGVICYSNLWHADVHSGKSEHRCVGLGIMLVRPAPLLHTPTSTPVSIQWFFDVVLVGCNVFLHWTLCFCRVNLLIQNIKWSMELLWCNVPDAINRCECVGWLWGGDGGGRMWPEMFIKCNNSGLHRGWDQRRVIFPKKGNYRAGGQEQGKDEQKQEAIRGEVATFEIN